MIAPKDHRLGDQAEGPGEDISAFAIRVGDLLLVRRQPAAQEMDPAQGAGRHGFAPLLLVLVHHQDEVGGQGHGGGHLAAAAGGDVDATLGHQADGRRVGCIAVQGPQTRRLDPDARTEFGLQQSFGEGTSAEVAFA